MTSDSANPSSEEESQTTPAAPEENHEFVAERHSHIGRNAFARKPRSHAKGTPTTRQERGTAASKHMVQVGDIRYMDGSELSRPLDPPKNTRRFAMILMIVAAVIGAAFLGWYLDGVMNEPLRQQQQLQENLNREVTLDLPSLKTLMPLDDEDIMDRLSEEDYTLYERTPIGTNKDGGFEVIKLPQDVTVEEAGLMYMKGVDNLSADDAVRLLKGAWVLDVSRKTGDSMRVRYADFDSGSLERAMQNALQAEGLENATVEDSGVDDSGNTFQTGSVKTKKGTYKWRVSVIDLSEVYDISGLPNTAFYVGIRFSA